MQVSFINESIDNLILEYADPKTRSIFAEKENKNYKKFFNDAYKELETVLKANKLKLKVSNDLSMLSIIPKQFAGQLIVEHSQDPRADDLFTIIPYGFRGSDSVTDRLQDGVALFLDDVKSKKGFSVVKKVFDNIITSKKLFNEALLEDDNDIYSSTERQEAAKKAELEKQSSEEGIAENPETSDTEKKETINLLKEAEKALLEHLKALDIKDGNGFKIISKIYEKDHKLIITLECRTLVDLYLKYNLDNAQAFVTKITTTLGESVDMNNMNIIDIFKKLAKKLHLQPEFSAAKYFTVGKYQEETPKDPDPSGENTNQEMDNDESEPLGSDSMQQDTKDEDPDIKAKNTYQESLIKVLLKNTVKENREDLSLALSKNDFTSAIKLLKDKNNRLTLTDTKVRVAFSRLILFNICGVTKPDTFDDIRALDFFAAIKGFKVTIDPKINQNLDIIKRYIDANPSAIFTASSADQYLFEFLTSEPISIDKFDRIISRNSSPINTLFNTKDPKPISNPISSIFYCRDFFTTYKGNAEVVYNLWKSFNPTEAQITEFKKILKMHPSEINDDNTITNTNKLKAMLDLPDLVGTPVTKSTRNGINKTTAKEDTKIKAFIKKDTQSTFFEIKKKIFLIGDNKFKPNISEIERGIDLFELVCKRAPKKGSDTTGSETVDSNNLEPESEAKIDTEKVLNTLLKAEKSDTLAQGFSGIVKQLVSTLKNAESNSELSTDLKNIQKSLISILKNNE